MSSCLGLYIENNVIKYAKVSKERETLKVESFGMKFYEKLDEAVNQIIAETYSYKIPISVNLSGETYNYFNMFSLLNKTDLKKAIETEFEAYCFEKNINKNAFESRYALVNDKDDRDKIRIIHVTANKANISKMNQFMQNNKLTTITPIGMSIPNVASIKPKENILIVNMEDTTTLTSIIDQKVYDIARIKEGSEEVLEKISAKENSYSKAYEICKNSTIYTMEGKELQDEENEYLEDIMPTLYKIVTQVQEYVTKSIIKYDTIYITGTLSVINNIDLYFQEFFTTEKCEILKPYFITDNTKINIKDYIEVNSAIAIAAQGLEYGIRSMNFKEPSFSEKIPEWMKIKVGGKSDSSKNSKFQISGLNAKMDATERWLFRTAGGIFILILVYAGFSIYLNKQIEDKISQVEDVKKDTETQIQLVENDTNKVKQKTNKYIELSDNLRNISQSIENNARTKNIIPNLLVKLMSIIPEDVQLLEIENTTGTHIVIKAQSKKYEQLGYFKAKIKEDNILNKSTVVSSQGEKQDEFVKVVIEGDLP